MNGFKGLMTTRDEWLYPDTPLGQLENHIEIATPLNGKRGVQILVESDEEMLEVAVEGEVDYEIFEMLPIPVEYNTVSDEHQGGTFVQLDYNLPKPQHATRKAPFDVYDCLKPVAKNIRVKDKRGACYITLQPLVNQKAELPVVITIKSGSNYQRINVAMKVFDVSIPEGTCQITNWFNLECMATYHHVAYGSNEHLAIIRKYAQAMKRVRQTHFYIHIDEKCIVDKQNWTFDFSYLKPIIDIFFEEGLKTIELAYVATRSPHYVGKTFNFALDSTLSLETMKGYSVMNKYLKALSQFLKENHWEDCVVFHISDEPDVHTTDEEILEARQRTYFMIGNQVRKYMPGIKIIEAVGTPNFRGGIDIWVPLSVTYEKHREQFDELIAQGEEVWSYVCCSPAGAYLNRFLDFALIKSRLIFWGCEAYGLTGFLHWGFNMFLHGMEPFKATSCHNETGLGTNFPCGDAFIVYPGEDGPWLSMRLEAQRKGAEDYELLRCLKQKNPSQYNRILSSVFKDNQNYLEDTLCFENYYEALLRVLENKQV